jgi:hypothetical protein
MLFPPIMCGLSVQAGWLVMGVAKVVQERDPIATYHPAFKPPFLFDEPDRCCYASGGLLNPRSPVSCSGLGRSIIHRSLVTNEVQDGGTTFFNEDPLLGHR